MKKKPAYLLIIFLLSVSVIGCKYNSTPDKGPEKILISLGNQSKELKFSFPKVEFQKKDRIWKKIQLTSKFIIGGIENEILINPARVKIDENSNIYILDWDDCSIKKFDQNGKFIAKYGKKGKGPGEFSQAFNFDVIGNGKIAVLGPNDNKFAVFEDGKPVEEVVSTLSPIELCFLSPDEVLTFQIMDPFGQAPFQKFNYRNKGIFEYQNILSKEGLGDDVFGMLPFIIGSVHRYKHNNMIYISSILGYVVIFDKNGMIVNTFRLIDDVVAGKHSDGRTKIKGMDAFRFPHYSEYLFTLAQVHNDKLYVFRDQFKKTPDEHIIDVYSIKETEYKYSFLLKGLGEMWGIFVTDKMLYIVKKDASVEVYDYKITI